MKIDLMQIIENVQDEESFICFLHSLMNDRLNELKKEKEFPSSPYGPGATGWQNSTIEDFIESAIAWANDTRGNSEHYTGPSNPWKRAAQIILAGKTYE